MGVLSSAWCPGGRTTAKPFCGDRQEGRQVREPQRHSTFPLLISGEQLDVTRDTKRGAEGFFSFLLELFPSEPSTLKPFQSTKMPLKEQSTQILCILPSFDFAS